MTYAPEAEWHLAGIWANYTPEAFFELDGDDQARIVALYRLQNQIDAVMAKEHEREMRRLSRQKGHK